MRIIPVISGKGGVGKTLVSINVANALKQIGKKPGVLDADITGPSALKYLHIVQKDAEIHGKLLVPPVVNGIEFMSPALFLASDDQPILLRGKRRAGVVQQFLDKVEWHCDHLIIDCPPGSTDEISYLVRERKKDLFGVIVVATPSDIAMTGVRKSIVLCQRLEVPILGIVSNMTEYKCINCGLKQTIFSDGHDPVKQAADTFHVKILAKLPLVHNMEENPLFFTGYLQPELTRLV